MQRVPILYFLTALSTSVLSAQTPLPRANIEVDAAGVFPVAGFKAEEYSSGPGLRVGGDLRLHRYLLAEGGWTAAWMATDYNCSRFGCSSSRLENQFLDYGIRGALPLANGRVELSLGLGGGYIWFDKNSGDSTLYNGSLLQFSGKAAFALNRSGHWRINATARLWRDLGRPVQQWLSTSAGISYGF